MLKAILGIITVLCCTLCYGDKALLKQIINSPLYKHMMVDEAKALAEMPKSHPMYLMYKEVAVAYIKRAKKERSKKKRRKKQKNSLSDDYIDDNNILSLDGIEKNPASEEVPK